MQKSKPILFSTEMVQALLDGRKTQTRRVIKDKLLQDPVAFSLFFEAINGIVPSDRTIEQYLLETLKSPYEIGQELWVRETWGYNPDYPNLMTHICYKADKGHEYDGIKWKSPIHMPRAAARIFLKIKDIRIEKLQEISEEDAKAEGVRQNKLAKLFGLNYEKDEWTFTAAKESYQSLWNKINGKDAWEQNPYVWVIEFEIIKK